MKKIFCCMVMFYLPIFAYQGGADYLIEKIRVSGTRHTSSEIVIATSLLVEGRTYNERILVHALRRVNRLPFVLEASYRLEQGSRDDTHILVIDVREAWLFYADIETSYFKSSGLTDSIDRLALGARWFAGSSSLVEVIARPDVTWTQDFDTLGTYSLSYKHFNLFDKNVQASLSLTAVEDSSSTIEFFTGRFNRSRENELIPRLALEIPLKGDHRLKTEWTYSEVFSQETVAPLPGEEYMPEEGRDQTNLRYQNLLGSLFWERNTVDSDFAPSSGSLIQAGLRYGESDFFSSTFNNPSFQIFSRSRSEDTTYKVFVNYRKHRSITSRHSWHYGGGMTYQRDELKSVISIPDEETTRRDDTRETGFAALEAGYTLDLWGADRNRRYGDFRFHLNGLTGRTFVEDSIFDEDFTEYGAIAKLAYRSRWGKISLSYRWSDHD